MVGRRCPSPAYERIQFEAVRWPPLPGPLIQWQIQVRVHQARYGFRQNWNCLPSVYQMPLRSNTRTQGQPTALPPKIPDFSIPDLSRGPTPHTPTYPPPPTFILS